MRLAADPLRETPSRHELKREVREPFIVAVFVDLDNSRVLDLRDGAGLGMESSDLLRRGMRAGQDHFQRDQSIQPQMPGFVDDAHPAPADLGDDLVPWHSRRRRPRPTARRRDLHIRADVRLLIACHNFARPGPRVRRETSARHRRVGDKGCIERFGYTRRPHVRRCVHTGHRRDLRLGDGRTSLARNVVKGRY